MKSRIDSLFRRLPNGNRPFANVLLALAFLAVCGSAGAQVSFNGVYTENFNGMGTSGTAAPTGWGFYGNLGGSGTTWTSSIPAGDAGLGTLNATLIASTSTTVSSNTQGYNYAASGSTADRCLGSSPTTGRGLVWQLTLSNLTGAPVTALGVRYDLRRFNAPSTANELPGDWLFYSLDNGTTWINASSLNPTITTVPNSTGTSVMVESNLTLASAWAANSTLLLRWADDNAGQSSPDQIIGLDNVSISTAPPAADAAPLFNDGQHVTMGTAAALGASSFTIECWFMRTGLGTTASTGSGGVAAVPLVAKGRGEADGSNLDCNYFLGINAAGNLAADFEQLSATNNGTAYNAGQNFPVVGSSVVQSGVWNHAAATYDTTTAQWKLYLNGVEETLTVPAGSPATFVGVAPRSDSIQHFAIGTAMNSSGAREGAFHGIIDEVRVWNVARSGSAIAAAKGTAITTAEPGLLARYGMNEGTGTTLAGVPAAAPSGTLSGSPLWTNGFNAAGIDPPSVTLTAPAEGASYNLPAVVNLEATAADTDGTVAKVEFFAGANKLGEDTTAPYAFAWSGMISGSYVLTARATDNDSAATTSAPVNVTIANPNNVAPSVTLTAPANGTQIAGSSTTLAATANDTDGVIAKVEFYEGANKLGEDTSAPYTYQWSGVTTGTYTVTARAIDNDAAFTNSAAADVTFVVPVETTAISRRPAGQPGAVWKYLDNGSDQGTAWKEPTFDDSAWASGAAPLGYTDSHIVTTVFSPASPNRYITTYFRRAFSITGAGAVQALKLNVLRDDGVVVYINGVEVARQNMPEGPINHLTNSASIVDGANETTYFTSDVTTLPPLNEGDNVIAVELHQRDATSSDLGFDLELVTVSLPGTPPTIELTSPTEGAPFTAPATIAITADAVDTDGSVAKVEFYNGTEKLGEDTSAPFTFDWTTVPQGAYTLTARATDNYGLTTTSDPISINVGPPNTVFPTVTITAPTNGAEFLAPGTIAIAATAGDSDGTVTKVEFFNGTTKLGEDTNAPYTFDWSNVPVGSYTLTAKATDNLTAATTSTPVMVEVVPNLAPTITLATPLDAATGLGGGGRVNLTTTVSDPENLPLNVTFYGRPKTAPPGQDFTLVTLPDTQFYSENSGGNRLQHFTSQTNWIVSAKDLLNTKFVAHMGDMVQNGDAVQQEWINADGAMQIVENPATTMLTHGIPWGGAPGNHDQQPIGSPDGASLYWNQYFGASRWAGRPYWGGNYSTNNDNNYQLFSASGMDFIVINMEYRPSANQAVLDWADALLKAHPTRRAIITSHWLIDVGNPAPWGGHGQAVYDNLKDNPNLFLMLCGHIHGEGRRADVFEGRTVNTVLQDYQSRANGGDSWLRYFTFKPSENKIYAYTYQTRTNTYETDADSQFTLDYNMAATAPWTDLGTVSLAAGETTATLPWTGLVANTEYEWYAAVSDGVTPVGSTTRSFTASGNATPSVTLTAPADSSIVTRPATVNFAATASDLDGGIAKVEFYNGATKVGEDDTAPYAFAWDAPSGVHTVSARAIDGEGAFTDSATAAVTVKFDLSPVVTGGAAGGSVTGGSGVTAGSTASFVAVPNSGYTFVGWTVNGTPSGTNPTLDLVVAEGMTIAAQFAAISSPFTPGNIVVYRVGDGSAALSSAATAVFLDEYTPTGTFVQSVPLPTTVSGSQLRLVASGTSTSEGILSRSADGQYLIATGYDAAPGTAGVTASATTTTKRVIARIDPGKAVNTTTGLTAFSASNIRGATSSDGTAFWATGANTGIVYAPLGMDSTTVSTSVTNTRTAGIFGGQLYVSSGSGTNTFRGVSAVGTGLPTTAGSTTVRLPGLTDTTNPSTYGFFFADLDAGVAGADTLYVADDAAGALTKFALVSGSWVSKGVVSTDLDYRGLAGTVSGGVVTLFATRDNSTSPDQIVTLVDASGYNGNFAGTPTTLATAATNTAIRGIAMAPEAAIKLLITEVESSQAQGSRNDFWELTNVGIGTVDLGNWKWDDDSRNPADAAAVTIPAGTMIAPGESIIFTGLSAATFRTWWGLAPTVQVISTGAAPGLGQNDAVALFNAAGTEMAYLSYIAGGFTRTDGSPSAGGHAGASAGGSATASAIWNPAFGTTSPRYSAAVAGALGAFASAENAGDVGSPGFSGYSAGGGPATTLSLSATSTTFSESATNPASVGTVTRSVSAPTDLTVNLSSSDTTEATVPATVTIPANQTFVTFDITAVNDTFPDGNKTATITASATGITPGTLDLTVQDDADVLDTSFFLTEIQSNQSAGKPVTANDYWELTNISASSKDISGYSWHDSGRSGSAAAAYKLPAGTTIAPGESVIFTAMPAADFRLWWNLAPTVQVFQSIGAPGLGQGDGISFFDNGQNELFFFSYAAAGFTKEDGSPSSGAHAGPSAGGSADSQALIWVPSSGTTTPRYTFATGTNYASFSAASPATDLGSPGTKGAVVPTVRLSDASVLEGNSSTTSLALTVTRSDTSTAFTVDYTVTGGSATSTVDYAALANGTLTFASGGSANQSINLSINGDTASEPDETIIVTLSNVQNTTGTTLITTASGTGTILNDDVISPSLTLRVGGSTIATGGVTTLRVAADGFPAPTLQWYQGLKGDTSNPVSGATSPTLLTSGLSATTNFWVRASNGGGDFDSDTITVTVVPPITSVDLSNYVRVGRYNLPEPLLTALPAGTPAHNLLCQEASGIAYNWDTDTLFVVADGGRSVTQVSKTGVLIDTMTLALGSSPQGTDFYDIEGIAYVGGGQFVMSEERDRQLVKFTYAAGTTLSRSGAQTVKIGTFVDNTGTEGLTNDPLTNGFICLKEISPIGIFQTSVDFTAGTASNGSPTTVNSSDLFNPTLLGMTDVADVFALSNLPSMTGQAQQPNLIVLSQEDGKLVNINRSGVISSTRQLLSDSGNPLSVAGQQHEGVTMDSAGFLYIVNENGGGGIDFPQLWVFAPSTLPNAAPTGLTLNGQLSNLLENANTGSPVRVGDIAVTDDGLGQNVLSLSGTDASFFEITGAGLFLKAGTVLDFETKSSYSVTIEVNDTTVGTTTPDASLLYTLAVTDQNPETVPVPSLLITEVAPWSSGNSPVAADWFEVTNISATPVDITGWKVDDSSKAFGSAVALSGITSIAPGESVIFIETADLAGKTAAFLSNWFGSSPPSGLRIGNYTGAAIGLSTSGDAVYLFDALGQLRSGISFGASPTGPQYPTFDNTAGLNDKPVTKQSLLGANGAALAASNPVEIGSPGYSAPGKLIITEVAPWSSGNSPVAADWFEVTNIGGGVVDIAGWKVDDSSESPIAALALTGIASIAPGESVIFIESGTPATTVPAFLSNWFGASPPPGLQIGTYSGSGIGLSTGGDAVNLYDTANVRRTNVAFGASPTLAPFTSFDNSARLEVATITRFSAAGTNGAFVAANSSVEIGSPGVTNRSPEVGGTILSQAATGGTAFSLQIPGGTFVDPEGQPLTYSATRGDNSPLPAWLTFDPVTRTFSGTPGAGDGGALVVKLTATDGGSPGLASVITFTIQVTAQLSPPALLTGPSTTVAPYLTSHLPGVSIQSLLTTGDGQTVPKVGGGTTRLVGICDGLGAYDNGDGTFTILMNHEITNTQGITRAHGAVGSFVSKWVVDKTTKQVVSGDDLIKQVFTWGGSAYALSGSPFAFDRLCSADLPAATALLNSGSGNGSSARLYLNGEETSGGRAFAHVVTGPDAGKSYHLAHFGFTNFENVLLSPKPQDKTIAIMTNDSGDGEVFIYVGTKNNTGATEPEKAGLTGGTLYGLAVPGKPFELSTDAALAVGPTETFTLASIGGPGNYPTNGTDTNNRATTAGVLQLGGPEDGAWDTRPGYEDTFYFVTKGTSSNGINAPTRLWKMEFTDIANPENGGTLTLLLDGPDLRLGSCDNMTCDDGKLLIQEDLGDDERLSKIWQYDLATGEMEEVAEHRGNYFYTGGANFLTINEESSGIIPLRSILGAGWYAASVQVHTNSHIASGDRTELVEGGQLVLLNLNNRERDLVRTPLVEHGDTWKYDATGSDPGTTWKNVGFSDGAWSSGPSMLGYGDDTETQTDIPAPGTPTTRPAATYYRTTFDVANPASTILLDLYMKWDDGAVVYINGVEVARPNMSRTTAITHTTFATVNDPLERDWKPVSIPCENLNLQTTGNVLAISIHQENASSSDTRIDAELFAWSKSPDPGTAPALPTGLAVSNPTNDSLDLDWNAQSDAKFFVIERQKTGELTWQVIDGDVPGTFTGYTDRALAGGATYSYRIWAVNQHGASACTAPQSGTTTNVIIPTIFFEDFSTTTNSSQTGSFTTETGIRTQSLASSGNWYVAGPFGALGKVANGNGFGRTPAGEGSDEWMFLPPLNTDFYSGEFFSFLSDARFNDTGLAGLPAGTVPTASTGLDVLISTNYDPAVHTDPRTATWTLLNPQAAFDTDFSGFGSGVASGGIDLSSLQGIATIAFRYRSSGTVSNAARHWEVTDFQILGSAGIDFETATGLAPFTAVSTASNRNWAVATMAARAGASGNNFGGDVPADDWLISPAFASVFDNTAVSFDYFDRFADLGAIPQGKPLAVLVSTNYDPAIHTNPSSATWRDITPAGLDGSVSNAWRSLSNVPLGLTGTNWNVHVAFRYQSSGTGSNAAKQVGIDKVVIGRGGGPLGVDFNFTQTGNESTFTPSISGGTEPYTVSWNFGDSSTATGDSPSHIFANNGNYTVTVTVTDAAGASTTATKNVVTNFTEFAIPAKAADLRVATFNTAMNSDDINGNAGDANAVANALASGTHPSIKKVAEVIQRLNPDVVFLNEVDLAYIGQTFDAAGTLARVDNFRTKYLGVAQAGDTTAVTYPYHYIGGTNTGLASGYDLRNQGGVDTTPGDQGYGDDSFGFGQFPGKYGFVVLSKYPIDTANARTFQKFLWKDMPGALLPEDPADTDGNSSTASFYTPAELNVFRLSSKNHWDVPVMVGGQAVHLLCSHPTPPVFDDGETLTHGVATGTPSTKSDWNGLRNNDEIRFWADYIDPAKDDYIYDDSEVTVTGTDAAGNQLYTGTPTKQGLGAGESFVIVGDLNSDPVDGDSSFAGVTSLTTSTFVDTSITPESTGSLEQVPGSFSNRAQKTSSFNLRADYALPSVAGLDLIQAGVHWPKLGDATSYLLAASDHRSTWVDLDLAGQITVDPIITGGAGGSVNGGGAYAPGSTATFTAVPSTGYRFVGWTVNGAPAGTTNPLNVTVSAGLQVEATFAYVLQVLHYYGESGLLGVQTAPIMGAMIDKFDDDHANTLVLGEGDSFIPGPWLVGGADPSLNAVPGIGTTALGRPDIAIMNAFGTTASALGNHEFDLGSPVLQSAITPAGSGGSAWVGAQFPLITANLDFAADSSLRGLADATLGGTGTNAFAGQEVSAIKAKIAPYAIKTLNGEKIGFIGATTWELLSKSSPNGTVPKDDGNAATSDLQEVAAYLQGAVNALQGLGVNKVVLVDQLDTLQRNKDLAGLVSGIDIMVAGGGHEYMKDANDVPGIDAGHTTPAADAYPISTVGADGKPVLIVTTDTEYSYLGRLVVDFNTNGELILGNLDNITNGAYASNAATLQSVYNTVDPASTIIGGSVIGSKVKAIADAINNVVSAKDGNIFGFTSVYLEGDRVFGRTQEVNLGNITADANAAKAKAALGLAADAAVFSLKNGGGLRASIGSIDASGNKIPPIASGVKAAGAISQLDIENALRFDNKLMVFDTTPQGLLNILNFAAGLSGSDTAQSGGYPQVGNLRFSYDRSLPAGQKVRSVALYDEDGNLVAPIVAEGAVLPGAPAVIQCVSLSFTANGGDGYPIKANADNFRYLLANGSLSAAVSESLDFTVAGSFTSVGLTGAADVLGEQVAFQQFLAANHGTPGVAYNAADTPISGDLRIQILSSRSDTVLDVEVTPSVTGNTGGSVTGGGILAAGSTATFTALPDTGFLFRGWLVNGVASPETSPTLEVIVTAGLTVEATFTRGIVRPDGAVGKSVTSLTGVGAYGPVESQEYFALSRRLKPVKAVTTIANRGDFDDTLRVRSTPGNRDFAVTHLQAGRNITAALATGRFETVAINQDDALIVIQTTVTPNKRTLTQVTPPRRPNGALINRSDVGDTPTGRRGDKKKTILSKTFAAQITVTSTVAPALSDAVQIRVTTR